MPPPVAGVVVLMFMVRVWVAGLMWGIGLVWFGLGVNFYMARAAFCERVVGESGVMSFFLCFPSLLRSGNLAACPRKRGELHD